MGFHETTRNKRIEERAFQIWRRKPWQSEIENFLEAEVQIDRADREDITHRGEIGT